MGKNENRIVGIVELKMDKVIFSKISCGHNHTIAIDTKFKLYTWGMGS